MLVRFTVITFAYDTATIGCRQQLMVRAYYTVC